MVSMSQSTPSTQTEATPVYATSVLLYPELRQQYLERVWAHQPGYIQPAIDAVRELWIKHFKPENPLTYTQDFEQIRDPAKRWRAEMTRSSVIVKEFDDFIKV
jgi:hypothetical protein